MSIIAENDDAHRVGPEALELATVRTFADNGNYGPRPNKLILGCFLLGATPRHKGHCQYHEC